MGNMFQWSRYMDQDRAVYELLCVLLMKILIHNTYMSTLGNIRRDHYWPDSAQLF